MKNTLHQFLHLGILLCLLSCGSETTETAKSAKEKPPLNETLDMQAKRHVEAKLSIPANEKYSLKLYRSTLDGDDKEDAIITVNRLDFARREAEKSSKTAQQASIGFMGNHNYIFYYDGALDQISPPIAIPSSPLLPLKISFEHISSEGYMDIVIDYRIMNASFRDYFTVTDHTPKKIFQWKNFDGLVKGTPEAYHFEYAEGTMGPIKDILVKKAELIQPKSNIDPFTYEPELIEREELVHRFFYHPGKRTYMTKK
jgi:hypothetical protein